MACRDQLERRSIARLLAAFLALGYPWGLKKHLSGRICRPSGDFLARGGKAERSATDSRSLAMRNANTKKALVPGIHLRARVQPMR